MKKKKPMNRLVNTKKEIITNITGSVVETKNIIPGISIGKEKAVKAKTISKKPVCTSIKTNKIKKQKELDYKLFYRARIREYREITETPKAKILSAKEVKCGN